MCGIAGVVAFGGGGGDLEGRARAMGAALAHRGPDGRGLWCDGRAALAHSRLAILDKEGGKQPMRSRDGRFVLVYNGEVYNHVELRRELGGPFETRSDAETLLAAYATWGEACFTRLNGMFALALWDTARERLLLARDRLGVKPLAYAWDGRELTFASEAHVVARAASPPVRADERAFLEYLVAPVFSGVERSMFAGVELLQPGHTATFDLRGRTLSRYYRFCVGSDADASPGPEELASALSRAVERTQMSDVPLAVSLSGGLDSTLVASLATRTFPSPPSAFTIAFEGADRFDYARSAIVTSDDLPFARAAAGELGLELTLVHAPQAERAADLARVAAANDALPAWEQEVSQHRIARAVRERGQSVLLVGDAADETHFGYHFLLDPVALSSPRRILERFGPMPIRRDVLEDPLATFTEWYEAWFDPSASLHARTCGTTSLIVERWLPRLLHNGDIHMMAYGVEARVPFADIELLALAGRVAPAAGLAGGVEKALLREAARGLVPEPIRTRKKSALPKDQATESLYKAEVTRLLREPQRLLTDFVDVSKLEPLLVDERPLGEWERAQLFRTLMITHFAHHHGLP